MKADVFIFGKDGETYAKVEDFENSDIKIVFQNYKHPEYPQIHGEFIPYMSVIDLLFNCGSKSLEILTSNQSWLKENWKIDVGDNYFYLGIFEINIL